MSDKKSRKTRVHFEPSSLLRVAGSSKPKTSVNGVPEQADKLLTSEAPKQDSKLLPQAHKRGKRLTTTPQPASTRKGKAKKLLSKEDWDQIWSQKLCIECFKDFKEIRGTSREHPIHVVDDPSPKKNPPLSSEVGRSKLSESVATDRDKHLVKGAAAKPGAEERRLRLASQIWAGERTRGSRAGKPGSADASSEDEVLWEKGLNAEGMAYLSGTSAKLRETGKSAEDFTIELGIIDAILNCSRLVHEA